MSQDILIHRDAKIYSQRRANHKLLSSAPRLTLFSDLQSDWKTLLLLYQVRIIHLFSDVEYIAGFTVVQNKVCTHSLSSCKNLVYIAKRFDMYNSAVHTAKKGVI